MINLQKKLRRCSLKSKDTKKLLVEVSETLGTDIEQFFDSKVRVEISETEAGDLYLFNGAPLLARADDTLFFTLQFKEIFHLFARVVVDMGAVPYVCKGADVMSPGIREIKGEFKENELLLVVDERHGKPLAVGRALFSSEEMKTVKRGKTVKTLHYVGDKLWSHLKSF